MMCVIVIAIVMYVIVDVIARQLWLIGHCLWRWQASKR